jgi:hypothetical protein
LIALADYGDPEEFYVCDDAASFAWIEDNSDQPPESFFATAYALVAQRGELDDRRTEQLARFEQKGPDLTSGSYENDKAQLVASYASSLLDADNISELTAWLAANNRQIVGEYHGLWY